MSNSSFTFEQMCIRNEKGFSFDLGTLFIPSDPNSFDDVVFKLISKIDTSLLLLKTHEVHIESFTIIAIPMSSQNAPDQNTSESRYYQERKSKMQASKSQLLNVTALQNAWDYLAGEGWHGLQSLALLGPDSIPDTDSRKYSLYQYTTCIMDVIRANYMFQKFKNAFHHETLEMFDDDDIKDATQAVFGLLWKRSSPPVARVRSPHMLSVKRKSSVPVPEIFSSRLKKPATLIHPIHLSPRTFKRQNQSVNEQMSFVTSESEEEDEMEVDEEISFKNPTLLTQIERPVPIIEEIFKPQIPASPKGRRKAPVRREPSPPPTPSQLLPAVADITLGFETSAIAAAKGSRKSMAARKSLSSDWPEEERQNILNIYDNLNPNVSEQKRIALTCKYVSLLLEKELPSKLLYQWIQKKGRVVQRTTSTFNTPEGDEQKEVALKCYRELNETGSETARVAFTLKFLDVQYNLSITSKQLYTWLNEKPTAKKPTKKR